MVDLSKMKNLRMKEKLEGEICKDVSPYRTATGRYELPPGFYEDDYDYCDAETEQWIWSIGKEKTSAGRIFASTSGEFYQNEAYECLWLR